MILLQYLHCTRRKNKTLMVKRKMTLLFFFVFFVLHCMFCETLTPHYQWATQTVISVLCMYKGLTHFLLFKLGCEHNHNVGSWKENLELFGALIHCSKGHYNSHLSNEKVIKAWKFCRLVRLEQVCPVLFTFAYVFYGTWYKSKHRFT